MVRKFAFALVTYAAFAFPALAAQRGLPESAGCTHCLPSVVTGGHVAPVRGRAVTAALPVTSVTTSSNVPVARKGASPAPATSRANAVVRAECSCSESACRTHA